MNSPPSHDRARSTLPSLSVSPDGYVRLTPEELRAIPLRHLLSELDADMPESAAQASGACAAAILGFTEWQSDTLPALSLGWDWRLDTLGGRLRYERDGEVRSNVMLVDDGHRDMGPLATGVLLCAAVDGLRWQKAVADYITDRYACHLSYLTVTPPRQSL